MAEGEVTRRRFGRRPKPLPAVAVTPEPPPERDDEAGERVVVSENHPKFQVWIGNDADDDHAKAVLDHLTGHPEMPNDLRLERRVR